MTLTQTLWKQVQKKSCSTGAERQSKYVKNNPDKAKLSEAKRQFERMKVLHSDSYQAQQMREAAKKRKQKQRERERSANCDQNKRK